MATRHGILAAILLYVTLDLSFAAMPGAFVFDADEAVEAAHRGWTGRVDVAAAADEVREPPVATLPAREPRTTGVARPEPSQRALPAPRSFPRDARDPARPPSEEPH
jgi:hypothetical protein